MTRILRGPREVTARRVRFPRRRLRSSFPPCRSRTGLTVSSPGRTSTTRYLKPSSITVSLVVFTFPYCYLFGLTRVRMFLGVKLGHYHFRHALVHNRRQLLFLSRGEDVEGHCPHLQNWRWSCQRLVDERKWSTLRIRALRALNLSLWLQDKDAWQRLVVYKKNHPGDKRGPSSMISDSFLRKDLWRKNKPILWSAPVNNLEHQLF